jgi:hypothetical protein
MKARQKGLEIVLVADGVERVLKPEDAEKL